MQYISLQFTSMEELWRFRKLTQIHNYHIDSNACILQAKLTTEQISFALTKTNAEIMDQQVSNQG